MYPFLTMRHGHTQRFRGASAVHLVWSALLAFAGTAVADVRPNIVLIISDDHDNAHLGFMGHRHVHTPTLDRLAESGTVFSTAHLPMSRCHPTLASLLSGRWPHQSGIYYNFGTRKLDPQDSLPNLLRAGGYATFVDGKYWEGDPRAMGFTHGIGRDNQFVRQGQQRLFDFLDEVGSRQPFFVWYAPRIPHTPHDPPERYRRVFADTVISIPAWFTGDRQEYRRKERLSYAMEAWLDDGVSQLVDHLQESGQLDRTLFVFVIDNGWCNGLVSKGSPFEKGVRTPLFFSWPSRVPSGQRFDQLTSTLDIYPTILDFAGIDVPVTAAGRSLRPAIEGEPYEYRDALFGAIYPAFVTKGDERPERDVYALYMRDSRWKYIRYIQDVRAEGNQDYFRIQHILTDFPSRNRGDEDLYDLDGDPFELEDRSADPDHAVRLARMRDAVIDWWKSTGGQPLMP